MRFRESNVHLLCLGAHFTPLIVRTFQTSLQSEAADTRAPSSEDALEAVTGKTPPVHPEDCSAAKSVRRWQRDHGRRKRGHVDDE